MRRTASVLAIAMVAACAPRVTPPAEAQAPAMASAAEPATSAGPVMPAEPATQPVEELRAVTQVVARILESGPLGHGNCTQRSYRVEIESTVKGEALPSPSWVHFEHCREAAPSFDASNLEIGGRYRLLLVRGASANFGNEPMIMGAERDAAP